MPKICIVIPCYKHTDKIEGVISRLLPFGFPLIVVDDGNSKEEALELYKICENLRDVFLLHHDCNKGKGASVLTGLLFAKENRFTHAIQIDADGQHNIEDINKIVELINEAPEAVISGCPLYDDNAPKSRVIGRKITNFFVKLETLSDDIVDAMIGFRAYPVEKTCLCAKSCNLKFGMTFDIEILVRLKWAGTPFKFFETKVAYPKDGHSNFRLSDQFKISYIHTVLCTLMILRLPITIIKNFSHLMTEDKQNCSNTSEDNQHWSEGREKIGGYYGIRLMMFFYDYGGSTIFKLCLYPVMFFYYLFSKKQRDISKDFLLQVERIRAKKGLPQIHYSSFTHFMSFGSMLIDKINAWRGNIHLYREAVFMEDSEEVFYAYEKESRGKILLCSHLGNVDALRALGTKKDTRAPEVYSVFFTKNAQNFNNILKSISNDAQLNIIATDSIGPDTALKLSEIIENKGMIAIVGDRTPVKENSQKKSASAKLKEPERVCEVDFLGRKAYLPQGAFILASLLKCSVQCLFALKNEKSGKIEIFCRDLFDEVKLPRKNKEEALKEYVQKYAELLEYFALRYPYQWFNFFEFFRK